MGPDKRQAKDLVYMFSNSACCTRFVAFSQTANVGMLIEQARSSVAMVCRSMFSRHQAALC